MTLSPKKIYSFHNNYNNLVFSTPLSIMGRTTKQKIRKEKMTEQHNKPAELEECSRGLGERATRGRNDTCHCSPAEESVTAIPGGG